MTPAPRAFSIAAAVRDAFDRFQSDFIEVTRRARRRFELREWNSVHNDAVQRLDLYADAVSALVARLREGPAEPDRPLWQEARRIFATVVGGRLDRELAESFFNSVSRRIFAVVGQQEDVEFTESRALAPWRDPEPTVVRLFEPGRETAACLRDLVLSHGLAAPYRSLDEDCVLAAARIDAAVRERGLGPIDRIETLLPLFFRNKGAYIIGRVKAARGVVPLALALVHPADGVTIDAVLLTEDELSILFSYAYSYFHAPILDWSGTIRFLHTLMPRKRVAELYNALGHFKHGKTEMYRDLRNWLASSPEKFEFAAGQRGMVMIVFTLPSYDQVFKVIKDEFDPPKRGTRADVMAAYRLVTHHDRVGRLVDAQEFEHLEFERGRFSDDLLEALRTQAAQVVEVAGDKVILKHLYVERRVVPLNVYLEQAPRDAALDALLDWGMAVKNLAAANIFPGDLFPKNFGVTRHGRVVFYDYDEIGLLEECRFRSLPQARNDEDELASEPWFHVDENDIFPEEIPSFLGLPADLVEGFLAVHGDLFGVEFWHRMQQCHRDGIVVDIYPYRDAARLRPPGATVLAA